MSIITYFCLEYCLSISIMISSHHYYQVRYLPMSPIPSIAMCCLFGIEAIEVSTGNCSAAIPKPTFFTMHYCYEYRLDLTITLL